MSHQSGPAKLKGPSILGSGPQFDGSDRNKVISRIAELATLKDGWYDGSWKALTQEAVATAHRLLKLKPELSSRAVVFPTFEGGLTVEVILAGWDYSFEMASNGKVQIIGTELTGRKEYETPMMNVESVEFQAELDRLMATANGD
jgi:hypothetical protein